MIFSYDVLDSTEKIIFALRSLYRSFGYKQYRMGKFEEYDLYSRNKDFLVSDSIIAFTDTSGKLMALKPDVTLSIIKNNKDNPDTVQKLCYNENVYRVSKGTNAFKEIMQTGLECIGAIDDACIGEVLQLAAKSLDVCAESFVLEVSHLGILSSFVDVITDDRSVKNDILKCVSEKNTHGIDEICRQNSISSDKTEPLKKLLSLYGSPETVLKNIPVCNGVSKDVDALNNALSIFSDTPFAEKVQVDFSLVGDMNYYNGVIFKGFINGISGSVLSGGQYDKLMKKMGRKSKAVGFAVYLDMLDRLSIPDAER